jgi:hypothetical protein
VWVPGQRKMNQKYWARLGCWISPYYSPLSLGARFETYEPFISFVFKFFSGRGWMKRGLINQGIRGHDCIWYILPQLFSCAFAKLRIATLAFVMSVRSSVWNISTPTGRILMKFDIWVFLESRNKVCYIKIGRDNGYFTWRPIYRVTTKTLLDFK